MTANAISINIDVGDQPYYVHGPGYWYDGAYWVWVPGHWGPHHRVWYHGHYGATLIERGEARAYRATPLVRDSLGQVFGKTGDSASG